MWYGTDKITWVATRNKYEYIDWIVWLFPLRLSWMKRLFSDYGGTWKSNLIHNLEPFGGLFFFSTAIIMHSLSKHQSLLRASMYYTLWNDKLIIINWIVTQNAQQILARFISWTRSKVEGICKNSDFHVMLKWAVNDRERFWTHFFSNYHN